MFAYYYYYLLHIFVNVLSGAIGTYKKKSVKSCVLRFSPLKKLLGDIALLGEQILFDQYNLKVLESFQTSKCHSILYQFYLSEASTYCEIKRVLKRSEIEFLVL